MFAAFALAVAMLGSDGGGSGSGTELAFADGIPPVAWSYSFSAGTPKAAPTTETPASEASDAPSVLLNVADVYTPPVVEFFTADWCGPCRGAKAVVGEYDVDLRLLDVDQPGIASPSGRIPFIRCCGNKSVEGNKPAEIRAMLQACGARLKSRVAKRKAAAVEYQPSTEAPAGEVCNCQQGGVCTCEDCRCSATPCVQQPLQIQQQAYPVEYIGYGEQFEPVQQFQQSQPFFQPRRRLLFNRSPSSGIFRFRSSGNCVGGS